jgi:hypothetical protein
LLVGHAAIEGWQADQPGQAHPVSLALDADPVSVELGAEELGNSLRGRGRLERKNAPPIMLENERNVAPSHGQALHDI